ncbi:hypothetical protein PO25_16555 [Vibrio anguillarum]|uniref:HEPN domain-containing protein n=1 Tax=Vibrio anguillarum TaxID=55601 RepID=UPI00097E181A|nr:HEPN domain-containing protein [Vibrio anguillarum]MBT2949498.1 hypothetical protein [Vibrio anguillarum]
MQLDFRRPPLYHFKKQVRRLGVIGQIKNDFVTFETDKYGYKSALMNQFFVVQIVAMLQAHIEYLVCYHYEDPNNSNLRLKPSYCNKKQFLKVLNSFGSPSANQIDRMFQIVFSKKNIMSEVCAGELSNEDTIDTLKQLLAYRHTFAHTGSGVSTPLDDSRVRYYREFVLDFAESLDNAVHSLLYSPKG